MLPLAIPELIKQTSPMLFSFIYFDFYSNKYLTNFYLQSKLNQSNPLLPSIPDYQKPGMPYTINNLIAIYDDFSDQLRSILGIY